MWFKSKTTRGTPILEAMGDPIPPTKPSWYNHQWEVFHRGSTSYAYGIKKDGFELDEYLPYSAYKVPIARRTIRDATSEMYSLINQDIAQYQAGHQKGITIVRWP